MSSHTYGQVSVQGHARAVLGDVHTHYHNDPVSVAIGCVNLGGGVTNLMMRITMFVSEVRSARKDMDAVSRELLSLQMCLSTLKDDIQKRNVAYSPAMLHDVARIIVNCEFVLQQIEAMLGKLSSGRLCRRIQWAMKEQEQMSKLRSSLEANKSALEVALTLGSISMLADQKDLIVHVGNDTSMVLQHTEVIIGTTDKILDTTSRIDGKIDVLTMTQKDESRLNSIRDEIQVLQVQLAGLVRTNTPGPAIADLINTALQHAQASLAPLAPLPQIKTEIQNLTDFGNGAELGDRARHEGTKDFSSMKAIKPGSTPCPACSRSVSEAHEASVKQFHAKIVSARKVWTEQYQREKQRCNDLHRDLDELRIAKTSCEQLLQSRTGTAEEDANFAEAKILTLEKTILELQEQIHALPNMKQIDVEVQEKQSIMNVLDTQKEIVVRELEVLTEHIAHAKRTGEPINVSTNGAVFRDFKTALEELTLSFALQVGDLMRKKNDLTAEVANLEESAQTLAESKKSSSRGSQHILADKKGTSENKRETTNRNQPLGGLGDGKPDLSPQFRRALDLERQRSERINSLLDQRSIELRKVEDEITSMTTKRGVIDDATKALRPEKLMQQYEELSVKYTKVKDHYCTQEEQLTRLQNGVVNKVIDTSLDEALPNTGSPIPGSLVAERNANAHRESRLKIRSNELTLARSRLRVALESKTRSTSTSQIDADLPQTYANLKASYSGLKRLYFDQENEIGRLGREAAKPQALPEAASEHQNILLNRLLEIGWSEESALDALERNGYDIDKAADFLSLNELTRVRRYGSRP